MPRTTAAAQSHRVNVAGHVLTPASAIGFSTGPFLLQISVELTVLSSLISRQLSYPH